MSTKYKLWLLTFTGGHDREPQNEDATISITKLLLEADASYSHIRYHPHIAEAQILPF